MLRVARGVTFQNDLTGFDDEQTRYVVVQDEVIKIELLKEWHHDWVARKIPYAITHLSQRSVASFQGMNVFSPANFASGEYAVEVPESSHPL